MHEKLLEKILACADNIRKIMQNRNDEFSDDESKKLSKEYQKLIQLINSDKKLQKQFNIDDLYDFFTTYGMFFSKPLKKSSKKEFNKNFQDFLNKDSNEFHYYFPVSYEYKVIKNKKIGTGKIFNFNKLPTQAKKQLRQFRITGVYSKHMDSTDDEQYQKILKDSMFMQIKIKTKGIYISRILASREYQKNCNIFNFLTQNFFRNDEGNIFPYIQTYSNGNYAGSQFYYSDGIFQRRFDTNNITKITEIIKKKSQNEIERKIISVINIVGNSNDDPNIESRFLFCLIAIETLLSGNEPRGLTWQLSERVAFLLCDEPEWIFHYKEDLPNDFKFTKKYIRSVKFESSTELVRIMKRLYGKRSSVAHTKKPTMKISENDYQNARIILHLLIIKLLNLLEKGFTDIENKKPDSKSVEFWISKMKFCGM